MKHKGNRMELADERIDDLMRAYDEYIAVAGYIRMPDVYKTIVNMPSRRFWVSDIRATKVICAMMAGARLTSHMRPVKKEMFEEIFRRVICLREENPHWTLRTCCSIVVAQPAPKFYIMPGTAKIMVCKARKKWVQEKLKRLRLLSPPCW